MSRILIFNWIPFCTGAIFRNGKTRQIMGQCDVGIESSFFRSKMFVTLNRYIWSDRKWRGLVERNNFEFA